MAKQPEIHDHFTITIRNIPPILYGDVVADLAKRGITDFHHELVTDIVTFKNNKQHPTTGAELLEPWTVENPTFTSKAAGAFFKENGRTNAGLYFALNKLIEKGTLKKLGDKNYARNDLKAIAGPKPKKTTAAAKMAREYHEVDHREYILRYARSHGGRLSRNKLQAHFEAHGRKPTSVGGALHVLIQHKMIKQLGEGEYMLLAKGGAKPTPVKKAAAPKKKAVAPKQPNGNGSAINKQPAVNSNEEVTHG
jgi:hypothetical protein